MKLFSSQWTAVGGWSVALPAVDGPRTLVLVFAGREAVVADGLAEVVAAYPRSVVVGCSTAGEIQAERVHDDTVSVSIACFAETRLTVAAAPVEGDAGSATCGAALGRRLHAADDDLKAVFVLSDGLGVNGSAMTAALAAELEPAVVVTGGLAGDGDRFAATWVLVDGAPRAGWAVAVGLSGERLEVGHGSRGGWDIFGPERQVTRAVGNVLYELDGAPALGLYKTYLGERAGGLPATALLFPLSVRGSAADDRPLVRTILGVDERTQAMTFAGDVPEGSLAQLMRANFDRLVDGALQAALATGTSGGEPALGIAVSCVGRRLVLGARTEDELEAVVDALPAGSELCGFYAYGEISPVGGTCKLHNQTMTLTTLRERRGA